MIEAATTSPVWQTGSTAKVLHQPQKGFDRPGQSQADADSTSASCEHGIRSPKSAVNERRKALLLFAVSIHHVNNEQLRFTPVCVIPGPVFFRLLTSFVLSYPNPTTIPGYNNPASRYNLFLKRKKMPVVPHEPVVHNGMQSWAMS